MTTAEIIVARGINFTDQQDGPNNAPNKIYNVPVLFSVWLGALNAEWMIARGGVEFFQELAISRSNVLYTLIDESDGFYRTFVNDWNFRSRMQVVFTIGSGDGEDHA